MKYISRVLKYTAQHINRNPWQTVAVTLILAVTLLIGQLFVVVGVASEKVLTFFENQPQVTVFFKNNIQEEQIVQIKQELEKDSLLEEVDYISQEQAVEIYKNRYKDEPELLEFVTPEILPASLEISAADVTHLSNVAAQFRDNQFVDTVIFQQDLVQEILRWTWAIRTAGLVLLGILTFISVTLIWAVVSNAIRSFSREIEIMKLVGAGSWFVRIPFLLDAVVFALIATVLSTVALYYLLPYLEEIVRGFVAAIDVIPNERLFLQQIGLGTFGVGAIFTMLVTYIAMWSYSRK